jgi:type I restriction enzyme R subunit/putative DNA methylase
MQSITYRPADSLPADVVRSMQRELETLPQDRQDVERRKRIEELLERGYGCCALRAPQMARCVVDTWKRFAPERHNLPAWVVVPDHVHVLVHVRQGWELGKIVQSWKSYTGVASWRRTEWDGCASTGTATSATRSTSRAPWLTSTTTR